MSMIILLHRCFAHCEAEVLQAEKMLQEMVEQKKQAWFPSDLFYTSNMYGDGFRPQVLFGMIPTTVVCLKRLLGFN